ncbi:MAG: adenylate/guanylate cyclase domain-containing protein [Oscillospiraceae bacterium]|nr:adenylate/guanylate cyclase domain-containing protein [Oscillospiraceae bacterium]
MKKTLFIILAALLAAAAFTVLAALGVLYVPDSTVSDWLYQWPTDTDGQIMVVGIDQRSIEALGPFPWGRDVIAKAIDYLNSDPENAPAVIGIDVLFVGEGSSPEADAYLAQVCEKGKNVVVASSATFGSALVHEGENFYMDEQAVLAWDAPFDELARAADTGHINAMSDNDGFIRYGLLFIDHGEERTYSLSRVIYEKYCRYKGVEPNPLPQDTDGFFYIDYTTRGGAYYEDISVIDLVEGTVPRDAFAGKIVLIAPYAAGLQDEYRTSVDHAAPMYGIEIQANLIDFYRKGFYPQAAGNLIQLIVLFLITAGALVFFYDRKILPSVIAWLAVSLGWIALCKVLYEGLGVVLHVLWVPLAVTVLFVVTVAANYVKAAREKRKVTGTFGRYVDPAIMKELLEKGSSAMELGGKMYDIAVLFVDIRGFTTMSEALDPPTVVEIINMYLTLTTECIMRYHGTLDKFVGDCTMAFWNAPLPQEDPVYLACKAAMDMVEGSKALGEKLMERFGRTVSFGIGVNFGPAVVGNIGAPQRMDYTAIGDTVNTSARLEANAPGGKILISRAVADALGDRAKVTSLGSTIKLKGKAEGFEILTLDSLS